MSGKYVKNPNLLKNLLISIAECEKIRIFALPKLGKEKIINKCLQFNN